MAAMTSPALSRPRPVVSAARGMPTSDGAGVRMTRVISSPQVGVIDPFLLLDEFRSDDPSDYLAGFPDHPHRGFETVTYMLAGRMRHKDNHGHEGVIDAGGVQWMRAGRGLVHSEMPEQERGLMWGFQLWVNLPADRKLSEPNYQEIPGAHIPEERREGARVRVISGRTARGTDGAVREIPTTPLYFDVHLEPGAAFEEALDTEANACVYVYEGDITVGGRTLERGMLARLGEGDGLQATAGSRGARFLLLAARPLNEPVAWHGPFVMNTREELMQAFDDYRSGRF
jgi:hypothetical protein